MVGEVSDRIQYIFSADQFHEGKTPDPEETILYEDCLMTRVDQEEAAESGAGSGAAAAWNKQHLKLWKPFFIRFSFEFNCSININAYLISFSFKVKWLKSFLS